MDDVFELWRESRLLIVMWYDGYQQTEALSRGAEKAGTTRRS
ncbi:MAG: hypothetical protein PSN37_02685 [Alphaproteobacteria bacterium]|nr:hypothetical protein [Alphaproteobacteria bacterium]